LGAGHRGADPRGPSSWLTPDRSQSCLPGHNTERALEHYAIGFAVEPYPDGGYGFAQRDGVGIHLNLVPDLAVDANQTAVYLYVSDADALAEQWRLTRPVNRPVASSTSRSAPRTRVKPPSLAWKEPVGDLSGPLTARRAPSA